MKPIKRRKFLTNMTTAAVGGTVVGARNLTGQEPQQDVRVKLTVLKVTLDEELDEEYRDGGAGPCPVFEAGQEFVLDAPWFHPEGFCHWAWADIRAFIQESYFGRADPLVACCTDGIRPVFFRIERLEG